MNVGAKRAKTSLAKIAKSGKARSRAAVAVADDKWPMMGRLALITGSAAALWTLIYLGARPN